MKTSKEFASRLAAAIEGRLNPDSDLRRCRILLVAGPDLLVELLKPGTVLYECLDHALPEDAELVEWGKDDSGKLYMKIRSQSFAPVPSGAKMPHLLIPLIRHVRGEVMAIDKLPCNSGPAEN